MDEPSGGTQRFSGHWILTNVFVTQANILTSVLSILIYIKTSPNNNTIRPDFTNVLVVGNNISPTEDNSIVVGDLLITSDGLKWNNVYLIDGGLNEVMNPSKTNLIDIIDGGLNSVRNFGGDSKLRPIIDDDGDGTLV